ncbi:hypothetical protein GCM10009839_41980 [Catenulispora yoronensis]|uniref:Polysaccharide chain length determinant N-terminal domain-containing protein n=1 Tax=Catenulispora yoronensis TaxID=450799 RepID=A0ABP5FY67_9ACTN
MDLATILRIMVKRWYASIPALLLALALPAGAWFAVPPKYTSTSTISLLNSAAASSSTNRTGNPFTAFDNSLNGMADYLTRTLNSDQSMADLAKVGVTDLASAELATNASGPFITLTLTGKDSAQILSEMKIFDDYAISLLAKVQTDTTNALKEPLAPNTLLRAIVMVPPQQPVASSKSKLEDVAGAGVGGMVLLALVSLGAERIAVRRGKPATVQRGRRTRPAMASASSRSVERSTAPNPEPEADPEPSHGHGHGPDLGPDLGPDFDTDFDTDPTFDDLPDLANGYFHEDDPTPDPSAESDPDPDQWTVDTDPFPTNGVPPTLRRSQRRRPRSE